MRYSAILGWLLLLVNYNILFNTNIFMYYTYFYYINLIGIGIVRLNYLVGTRA